MLTGKKSYTLMLYAVIEFIAKVALGLAGWIICFPVVWLVSAPFILLFAAFSQQPYKFAVLDGCSTVTRFWADWGPFIVP